MSFFRRKTFDERLEELAASERSGERELETLGKIKEIWKPITSRRAGDKFISSFEGEKPKSLHKSFLWDWDRAGTEERQSEVFSSYLNKMTYSPELGYSKRSAGERLISWLAKRDEEEVS